jgi:prolyl-tRNA synthetase
MKMTELFGRTSKTEGLDHQITSHRLLTQAGYIRESSSGRYYLLPLGQKVHELITGIIRKHMDAAGAQELLMPVLHPLTLWEETNRTTTTGFELMKIKDRREFEFALGGTAEEMAVDLVRRFNVSYKDLPFNIYQFSMKFRDELRARGGLLRVREFVMKDAYSFGTEQQFKATYQQMWDTYIAIFNDMSLNIDVVAADNGYIGGEYCHEFIVESEVGESRYFIDKKTGYAAHEDVATITVDSKNTDEKLKPLEEVDGTRGTKMEDGVKLHSLPLWQQTKDVTFFDEPSKRYVLVLIRGDFDVNETKLMHVAKAYGLRMATEEEVRDDLNSEPGFISPVGMVKKGVKSGHPLIIVADASVRTVKNMYGGANKKNRDLMNINIDRDWQADIEGDVVLAQPGMLSHDGNELIEKRGIEAGNIFQLGYHYTKLMKDAEYTDVQGQRQPYYMGCYGIGIGRTLAAIVEAHHDDKGIIWPENVAPFKVYLASLGVNENVIKRADQLYFLLTQAGISVLYDNRDVRPGEKFADADLLGMPHRVVISERTIAVDMYEYKKRSEVTARQITQEELHILLGIRKV